MMHYDDIFAKFIIVIQPWLCF